MPQFIPHPEQTRSLGAPAGWDQTKVHCGSLSIKDTALSGVPAMESLWEFEPNEAVALILGSDIALSVIGDRHPPVAMRVVGRDARPLPVRMMLALRALRNFANENGLSVSVTATKVEVKAKE